MAHKFAELGNKGVLALLSFPYKCRKPGTTGSESPVGPAIKQAVEKQKAALVLATFRIQRILHSTSY